MKKSNLTTKIEFLTAIFQFPSVMFESLTAMFASLTTMFHFPTAMFAFLTAMFAFLTAGDFFHNTLNQHISISSFPSPLSLANPFLTLIISFCHPQLVEGCVSF